VLREIYSSEKKPLTQQLNLLFEVSRQRRKRQNPQLAEISEVGDTER
jgi:hypothetical protein